MSFEKALMESKPEPVQTAAVQAAVGRYLQEIQGMVFMAKQYPRDTFYSWQRIKEACSRRTLAEVASYEYPRGGEKVAGPSIRLAEVLAQCWGNVAYGVTELEQRAGESDCLAYAWDLETNVRAEKTFTVKHERKARGRITKLSDPRDIYEMVANLGARRQRACILAVIPKDIVDAAVEECEKTLMGDNKEPIADRLRKMLERFSELGITKEMIEKKQGYALTSFTEKDILSLGRIYNSIKDDMGKREDYFDLAKPAQEEESDLAKEFKAVKAVQKGLDNEADQQ